MTNIKTSEKQKKANYCFPNFLAQAMSKVDMRTQLEASMLSMSLILVGMFVSIFYMAFYISFPMWYKVVLIINLMAGLLFISSFLVTTFQQYQSYLSAIAFQEELKHTNSGENTLQMKGGTQ